MLRKTNIERDHPLRELFRNALDFGLRLNPSENSLITDYIEEEILCEFIHTDNLYKIKGPSRKGLDDIADMLAEGDMLINAQSFDREFQVHKHIGDYTLFMLSMFPYAISGKKGKEFVLSGIIVPGSALSNHYMLQGQQSYKIASEFTHSELFLELSSNFILYKNILELARIYLESADNTEYLKTKGIIGGTD
jgi:hypothetical protein